MICIGSLTRVLLSGLLVLGAALACLKPPAAHAACVQWDLSGAWDFYQTNNYRIWFRLQQSPEGKITGLGEYAGKPNGETGQVAGEMKGDQFWFITEWGRARGKYEGRVGPNGELQGSTADLNHPEVTAKWHEMFGKRARCMTVAAPPPATQASPKPIKRLGKKKLPADPRQEGRWATTKNAVDVYDKPVEPRRVTGTMIAFSLGRILDYHPDGWCKLQGVANGDQDGWVAQDHLNVSCQP
ncbi:MAG: hypothetical protein WBB50_06430 [Methyloceanibacter sp.]